MRKNLVKILFILVLIITVWVPQLAKSMTIEFESNQVNIGEASWALIYNNKKELKPKDFIGSYFYVQAKDEGKRYLLIPMVPIEKDKVLKVENKKEKTSFEIELKGEVLKADLIDTKDFVVLQNPYELPKDKTLIIVLSIIFSIIAAFFIGAAYLKRLKRKREEELYNKKFSALIKQLENAKNRKEIETLSRRLKRIDFIEVPKAQLKRFQETLDEVQYKENWSEFESSRVQEEFEKIRNVICQSK